MCGIVGGMKKIILIATIMFALVVTPVKAGQYGDTTEGEVLGASTEQVHEPVEAGIMDMELWQAILATGLVAVGASVLYKVTYKLYIFDR